MQILLLLLAAMDLSQQVAEERAILAELVASDTTDPPGNEERAAAVAAARFKKAGVPYQLITVAPHRQCVVARLKGPGSAKPLLVVAHLDVVGADASKWSTPPFKVTEKEGFLYGRGVADDKGMAAAAIELVLQLHREKAKLRRDVILALTAGEEVDSIGVRTLIDKHRPLIDAEFALNEGGGIDLRDDGESVREVGIGAAEKTFQSYELVAKGQPGHSSRPGPSSENAIYRLAGALQKLAAFKFPTRLSAVTRSYLAGRAKIEKGDFQAALAVAAESPPSGKVPDHTLKVLEKDSYLNAIVRTTCVATMLSAGIKENALPFEARAIVNCRLLPDETPEQTLETLRKVVGDAGVVIEPHESGLPEIGGVQASPVVGVVPDAIRAAAAEVFPKAPVFAILGTGASDSKYLRKAGIPSWGIDVAPQTDGDSRRAHGHDERVPVRWLEPGYDFFQRVVRKLAQ
jgi:acetylornithine deacetylase/succinyl-diaminopimelate desuccinylase-like protein